jgi:hypothetical protein
MLRYLLLFMIVGSLITLGYFTDQWLPWLLGRFTAQENRAIGVWISLINTAFAFIGFIILLMFGRPFIQLVSSKKQPHITDFANLWSAWRKAARGKRGKQAAASFEMMLEDGLVTLQRQLQAQTWQPRQSIILFTFVILNCA